MNEILFYEPVLECEWLKSLTDEDIRRPGDRLVEMTRFELATLCGLIKLKNPKNILEVGVASGGTSLIILNTLEILNLHATLYSCDINERYYANREHETGYVVKKYSPKLINDW